MTKFIIDPKTGRMSTEGHTKPEDTSDKLAQERLAEIRRITRDMIYGNVQFHDDPLAAKKEATPAPTVPTTPTALKIGDRVRVNDKCSHAGSIGKLGTVVFVTSDRVLVDMDDGRKGNYFRVTSLDKETP
jgi:hypothetical protein